MTVDSNQQVGRAKNALLSFFEERLSIPKIYLDAEWDGQFVDLLAINRDGVGDVHVAVLAPAATPGDNDSLHVSIESSNRLLDLLEHVPAQFKYVAYVRTTTDEYGSVVGVPHPALDRSLAPDGLGKIGFLGVNLTSEGEPRTQLLYKPERFRARVAKLADDYIQQHEADWELRA